MSLSLVDWQKRVWQSREAGLQRENRLAKLFDGYHYVLSILADIQPSFRPIEEAHARIVLQKNSKAWSPVIYKIVSLDEETKVTYLIGTAHVRFSSSKKVAALKYNPKNEDLIAHAKAILSEKVQRILKQSDLFAIECFDALLSEDYGTKINKLKAICQLQAHHINSQFLRDFEMPSLLNELDLEPSDGLEGSAFLFLLQENNEFLPLFYPASKLCPEVANNPLLKAIILEKNDHPITLFNLESGETQLKALEELYSIGGIAQNKAEIIGACDSVFSGTPESQEQFFSYLVRRNPLLKKHMAWRNPPMANIVLDLVNQVDTSTVMVGCSHLYGEEGILNLLRKQEKISITVL